MTLVLIFKIHIHCTCIVKNLFLSIEGTDLVPRVKLYSLGISRVIEFSLFFMINP